MNLSDELKWRGFVNQTTFKDLSALDKDPLTFYFGVDPSADSMQIGNLAAAMMVYHFILHGHKAILLVGGATGLIGDPDGKKDERNLQSAETVAANTEAIAAQYKTVFAGREFDLVNNYDWFKDMNFLDFLRTIGKNVPLSQMLSRDFVQSRIGEGGSGISYAEFSYSLIQGYDFLHLYREHGATLQVCGGDQWGNSIAGVDLIRRIEGAEANVYSVPLIINKTTGVKFGKSEGSAVWLDANKTSVYAFYQFWLNAGDLDVFDWLKIFTLLSKEEVEALAEASNVNPGVRAAQKRLAHEVTLLVHGKERTESVERVTGVLFGGESFTSLSPEDIEMLAHEIPSMQRGKSIIEILVESSVASSNGEAKRLIEGGAISINDAKIDNDYIVQQASLLKKGKNSFVLVR